jgi:aminoglycoside 3-N-acetyltransferase
VDTQKALEWIAEVFGVKDRVPDLTDTRLSVPEWDSLAVLLLQLRLREDHGIVLSDDAVCKIKTVGEICQLLERKRPPMRKRSLRLLSWIRSGSATDARNKHFDFNVSKMAQSLWSNLPAKQKSRIRSLRNQLVKTFLPYGPADLLQSLRSLGVQEGDTVLVHSSFKGSNGFVGSPDQVIDVFLEALGSAGNLMMVSLPYLSSTYEYLKSFVSFDVRRTPSQMGLISEIFRERKNVLRSLHPTHPILAYGPKAEWIVAGHENCPYPCGRGTPFDKLAQTEGKVLFFDVPFATLTFFHYLEDMIRDRLPFPLYHPEAFQVPVIDHEGRQITVTVYAFSPDVIRRRKSSEFESELQRAGLIKAARIGNTRLQCVEIKPVIELVKVKVERADLFFYDLS